MTTKLIVIAGFIIAFAAGLMTGIQNRQVTVVQDPGQTPASKPSPPRGRNNRGDPGMLIRELSLSPEQSKKMQEIWNDVAARGRETQDEARRKLRQQRDEQMLALVPEANRAQYEKVQTDFSEAMTKLDQDFRSAYDQAIEKSKKILNPEQAAIYQQILDRNRWDQNRGGRGGRGGRNGPPGSQESRSPATAPTTSRSI